MKKIKLSYMCDSWLGGKLTIISNRNPTNIRYSLNYLKNKDLSEINTLEFSSIYTLIKKEDIIILGNIFENLVLNTIQFSILDPSILNQENFLENTFGTLKSVMFLSITKCKINSLLLLKIFHMIKLKKKIIKLEIWLEDDCKKVFSLNFPTKELSLEHLSLKTNSCLIYFLKRSPSIMKKYRIKSLKLLHVEYDPKIFIQICILIISSNISQTLQRLDIIKKGDAKNIVFIYGLCSFAIPYFDGSLQEIFFLVDSFLKNSTKIKTNSFITPFNIYFKKKLKKPLFINIKVASNGALKRNHLKIEKV
eukprot:snap_masked-scaffold_19-processed-gene-4.23-mRNA-1 protein AED:1.00 eAED:1.00 QI:0/0/0/0/1/1/2/0/306